MQDAWRAYLELALGLTEASKNRAQTAVRRVIGSSGATAAQLQTMAEELLSTGLANRDTLNRMIRAEVDRALGAVGLATADEVTGLTARVAQLEQQVRQLRQAVDSATGQSRAAGDDVPAQPAPASEAVEKTVARKALAKKTVAKKAVAKAPVAEKQAVAEKAVARKAVAKKAVAKKAVAKKLPPAQP